MKRRLFILVIALAAGFLLSAVGCQGSGSTGGSSSKWVTFHSKSVSLQLPASFKGGDPRDPASLVALEDLAGRVPDSTRAENLRWLVQELRDLVAQDLYLGPELVMASEPDSRGRVALVNVDDTTPVDGWSLGDYVDEQLFVGSASGLELESQADDRAYFTNQGQAAGANETMREYVVMVMAGEAPCEFHYTVDDPSNTALEAAFRASARTIKVLPRIFYHASTSTS